MSLKLDTRAPFAPPVVDRVSIRVVVDSHYERFLPKATHPVVGIEHVGEIPGRQMTTLAGEWGLSLHLESEYRGARTQHLLDFGFTPEILNRNFDLLGVDPAKLNGLILSHGHRDHYGGLVGFVNQNRTRMREDLALYIGGETIFREKWLPDRDGKQGASWGALDRTALTAQKVVPTCCETPVALEGPFTTGQIERTSFETVTGSTRVRYEHFTDAERKGQLVKDEHPDEHGTCFIVKGRGLVIVTSCSHRGIVGICRHAVKASGVPKVHAIIGGFHLSGLAGERITQVVDAFRALGVDYLIPQHCTGLEAIIQMGVHLPKELVVSSVGSTFTFGD